MFRIQADPTLTIPSRAPPNIWCNGRKRCKNKSKPTPKIFWFLVQLQAPLFKLRGKFRYQVMVKCDSGATPESFFAGKFSPRTIGFPRGPRSRSTSTRSRCSNIKKDGHSASAPNLVQNAEISPTALSRLMRACGWHCKKAEKREAFPTASAPPATNCLTTSSVSQGLKGCAWNRPCAKRNKNDGVEEPRPLDQERAQFDDTKRRISEAAVQYEKYLRVLEVVYNLKKGELSPAVFNNSSRSKELTVIAHPCIGT